jgi:spore coat polysaccharide biosynthesis protein SpsF
MLKTLGIIQACFEEPGIRSKATRKLRGKTVLEWVVRRVTDCMRLDGVIVVTNDGPDSASLLQHVPADVPIYIGSQTNNLARFAGALVEYSAESVVRVRCENPFIDPGLIDRLVIAADAHAEVDYVSYSSRNGQPAILSPVGLYAEWFRVAALRKVARAATLPADRDEVTRYIYSHPELFQIRLIPAPPQIDRDDVRLAVDIEEDWEHALAIFDALGSEEFDWQRIADLLAHQPTMRRRMRDLNRSLATG